ncbi:hypothetical protein [Zavarzinia aquatilis]|uniref:Uncharacterized protein n=1 Tax=Zavarzinia aquatilis TaxID=2211142 RepID=A0A317DS01_9PROT|nr:hypothetical protein [Zavarzinia aquatilis]PWR17478.1 hypothetical protein DKG74_21365 [Zavarzinia aquatilis]
MRIPAGQVMHFTEGRPPAAADDQSIGAWLGSLWLDTSTGPATPWICLSAALGAASWHDLTRTAALAGKQPLSAVLTALAASATGLGWGALDLVRHHQLGSAAYLAAETLRLGPVIEINASLVLSSADCLKTIIVTAGSITVTLPPAAALRDPWRVTVKRSGATALTIARSAGDTINRVAADLTVAAETAVTLVCSSPTNFEVI